jgi:hypothetical protein
LNFEHGYSAFLGNIPFGLPELFGNPLLLVV